MNSFKRVRELEVLVLRRGENWSIRWKTSRGKEENKRQTQPTRSFDAVIWTPAHSRPQSPSFLGRLQIKPSGSGDENDVRREGHLHEVFLVLAKTRLM